MARQFGNIRKLPSGRYQVRYPAPPDGVPTPAPTTFTTKKSAAAYLADVQSDIERGRWKSREQIATEQAETAATRAFDSRAGRDVTSRLGDRGSGGSMNLSASGSANVLQ